ncbi:hypothetical protein CJZ69_02675 [Escherichia coli ATCC 8739]|nr:hypothetical protein CJZ69_02675 [Escherichia coli ATCC 8739]
MANKGLSQLFQTKAHLFFPISGIDSPQWSQNLVNYHPIFGSDSNLLIVFYVQIMPDDLVMQLHRF